MPDEEGAGQEKFAKLLDIPIMGVGVAAVTKEESEVAVFERDPISDEVARNCPVVET
jgi:hypothetical protein